MTTDTKQAPVTALLGRKLGMTQVWDADGRLVPLTVVQVDTNVVTQVRTDEADGYSAIQLAFGEIDERKVTKPLAGHFAKAGVAPRRHLAEVRTPAGALTVEFDPAREIALRDPQTGKPTGAVMTYAEVYAVLYSAYLDAALERDVQRAESTFGSEEAV